MFAHHGQCQHDQRLLQHGLRTERSTFLFLPDHRSSHGLSWGHRLRLGCARGSATLPRPLPGRKESERSIFSCCPLRPATSG
eukprot:6850701-Pyramimonas_sp.AAC.1